VPEVRGYSKNKKVPLGGALSGVEMDDTFRRYIMPTKTNFSEERGNGRFCTAKGGEVV